MAAVTDVAENILTKVGPVTAMKLQKLVYYSQAWSLVWKEKPLFESRIEAWANGPVTPELYDRHKGNFSISTIGGNASALSAEENNIVDSVVGFYNQYTAQQLSDLTHAEKPWNDARQNYAPGDRCNVEITLASLHEYYSGL